MKDIDLIYKLMNLKNEKRAHSKIWGIEEFETVADHSWGTAFLCLYYGSERDIDTEKTVKMAIVHDMAEAEIGDIPYRVDEENMDVKPEEKERREEAVWEKIEDKTEREDLIELWKEYEAKKTKEAKFVKDMDRIDLVLRTLENEKEERYSQENDSPYAHLDEIFIAVNNRIQTEIGRELFKEIKSRYEKVKNEKDP